MQTQNLQLLKSLQRSVQIIVNLYTLVKATPVGLGAFSVFECASLIENLLQSFYLTIPQMCAPMSLFKKLQAQNLAMSKIISRYEVMGSHSLIKIKILEDKLKQYELKEISLIEQLSGRGKNNNHSKKKCQSIKEIAIKANRMELEVIPLKKSRERKSLPRLDAKSKVNAVNINWEINASLQNKKFISYLMNK